MNKIVALIVGGFAAILLLPFFNTLWGELGGILMDVFNITADSPTGVTFLVWYRAMPYIAVGAVVILAFKVIRGRHDDTV